METLKHPLYIFWLCVVLHLIADYTLQGILAQMKQQSWWLGQVLGKDWDKYEHDWLAALLCHAAMWSILTFLPLMFVVNPWVFTALVTVNILLHAWIDHLKANKFKINLCTDQIAHLVQIIATVYIACRIPMC